MNDQIEAYQQAANYIRSKINEIPKTAVILGSGLGKLAENVAEAIRIPYE